MARITSEEDIPSSTLLSYMMAILVKVLQFERVLKKRSSSSHFEKEGRGKAKGLGEKKHQEDPKIIIIIFTLRQLLLYYYAYQIAYILLA